MNWPDPHRPIASDRDSASLEVSADRLSEVALNRTRLDAVVYYTARAAFYRAEAERRRAEAERRKAGV